MAEPKRKRYDSLKQQLESERSSFISHWRDLSDYVQPRRQRFNTSDVNKGDKRNQKIIDSTATLAHRTLRAGMMSGITSPARPWFRLTTPDPDLAEFGSVKTWLSTVTQRMQHVYLRSNLYQVLPVAYGDMGLFGTAAIYMEEDFNNVVRFYPFPIGSYCIANNSKLKVDVFTRDFRMTVRQLIQRFGRKDGSGNVDWSNFSSQVRSLWDQGNYEAWVDVCHVIQPNSEFDEKKSDSKFKKYSSMYYEKGVTSVLAGGYLRDHDEDKCLSEKGYDYFPVLCPRWEVTGEDVYGTDCPGMAALGDIKQLQLGEKRIAQAIEKMVNPPMVAHPSLQARKASIVPGDITYVANESGQQGFRPAHEVNPRVMELENKQAQVRDRIRRAFYEDLFLMLANDTRSNITATEVAERKEEKLLALGPMLEQLNQDCLDPLTDNTFNMLVRQGLIPEPPQELQGMDLKVEYISIMAQSQKLVGLGTVERFAGFAGQVASIQPEILDKIDTDQMIDVYGELTSIPPGIIRPDEKVQEIRQNRAQAQQAQVQAQQIRDVTQSARDLSQADMESDNALTRLIDQANAGSLVESA